MSSQPDHDGAVPDWTLGWRMSRAIAHAGISVEDIADRLGVSRSTISRWINDRGAPPRAIYLREWADLCGVSLDWLAGDYLRPLHTRAKAQVKPPVVINLQYCSQMELAA